MNHDGKLDLVVVGQTSFTGSDSSPAIAEPMPREVEFRYQQSDNFACLLHQLNISLLVTTYQANKLLAGVRFPEVVGFQKDSIQHTFIVPRALVVPSERLQPVA